jgi:hypothetical protein
MERGHSVAERFEPAPRRPGPANMDLEGPPSWRLDQPSPHAQRPGAPQPNTKSPDEESALSMFLIMLIFVLLILIFSIFAVQILTFWWGD